MASRVTSTMRPVHTVEIGGKRRRFHTVGAAWYAIAKSALGSRYLAAFNFDNEGAAARRGRALFFSRELISGEGHGPVWGDHFDTDKWTSYVRRVARKWRALDEYAARKEAHRG